MREDRHADAGSSHVGRPASRESSRISAFDSPTSSSGLRGPSARDAVRARSALSTPPLYATMTEPREASVSSSAASLGLFVPASLVLFFAVFVLFVVVFVVVIVLVVIVEIVVFVVFVRRD